MKIMTIIDVRFKELEQRLAERRLRIVLEPEAKGYLGSAGYTPTFGARSLNRLLQ
ncbi:hypothetical protein FRC08_001662 [Ceratobasidium sp. 394]|nr:hypothetical protein FRC08_001662 [Ceratobasidium sp. 394]